LFNWGEETRRHRQRLEEAAAHSRRHIESLESLVRDLQERSAAAEAAHVAYATRLEQLLAETQRKLELEMAAGQERVLDNLKAMRRWMKDTRQATMETDERFEHLQKLIAAMQTRLDEHVSATELLPSLVGAIQNLQMRFSRELREWRKLRSPLGWADDAQFLAVAEPLLETRRTLLGYDRLYVLWQAVNNVARLSHAFAEVGSFRGGSAFFLASAFKAVTGDDAEIHIVDTFEGHPLHKISGLDSGQQPGKFATTSYEEVQDYLASFPRLTVHKGEATDLMANWPDRQYSLVHLDVDLHDPTLWCLQYFGDRVVPGGIIVLDDFGAASCPGVAIAVEEFLKGYPHFQTWNSQTEQLVLVKQCSG
jgi:hypothetical protein